MRALEKLRDRMAELADLARRQMLAAWDQLVMMPAEGARRRGRSSSARSRG